MKRIILILIGMIAYSIVGFNQTGTFTIVESSGLGQVWLIPNFSSQTVFVNVGNQVTIISPTGEGGSSGTISVVASYVGNWGEPEVGIGGANNLVKYTSFGQSNPVTMSTTADVPVHLFDFDMECTGGVVSLMANDDTNVPSGNFGNNYNLFIPSQGYSGDIYTGNVGDDIVCLTLPLEMVKFNAKQINCQTIELDWATVEEVQNEKFIIEKSLNQGKTFEPIGEILSKSNSRDYTTYNFTDKSISATLSKKAIFYRLKQIDYNGHYQYSDIKLVNYICEMPKNIEFYPNPVNEVLYIDLINYSLGKNDEVKVELLNFLGKKYLTKIVKVKNGKTYVEINIGQKFPSGTYLCKISKNGIDLKSDIIYIMR